MVRIPKQFAVVLCAMAAFYLTISADRLVRDHWGWAPAHWIACAEFCAALVLVGAATLLLFDDERRKR